MTPLNWPDVLHAQRRIEEARLQELLRERAVGILRVQRLPRDEVRLLEDDGCVAGLLHEIEVLRVVERRQVQPEEAVRVAERIALLGPFLLRKQFLVVRLLDVHEVLRAPELREDDGVVDRLAAPHERRRSEAQMGALLRERGGLVGEAARLFEARGVEFAPEGLLHQRDGFRKAVRHHFHGVAAVPVDRRLQGVEAVGDVEFAHEVREHALRLLAGLHGGDHVVGLFKLHPLQHAEERTGLPVEALLRGAPERLLHLVRLAPEEGRVGLQRADAAVHRVQDLGGEEEVAPHKRLRLVR